MNDSTSQEMLAGEFERNRTQLRAVAYRMLGSLGEAEDAVQEAWLRLTRTGDRSIDNMSAWLTTVVGRICVDMLRARRARREEGVGTWLPEPVVADEHDGNPEREALIADSVGLALLVVLDTLTPSERLAFVLHDMFDVGYRDIGVILGRSPDAARQLASRARRRVRAAPARPDRDLGQQRSVVAAFLAAARGGDFDALVRTLHPDVTFRVDAGSRPWPGPSVLSGAHDVAHHAVTQGRRFAALCRPAVVNGSAGIVVRTAAGTIAVAGLTVTGGRIVAIDLVLDPDKLPRTG